MANHIGSLQTILSKLPGETIPAVRHLARFVAVLLGQYGEYLSRDKFDLLADRVGYRQTSIYANDEEFRELVGKLAAVLMEAYQFPREGRKRRWVTTIIMPATVLPDESWPVVSSKKAESQ